MYIGIVTLYVNDQDRAKEFYTKKLGWEVVNDAPMGEGRWLTVKPPGAQTSIVLTKGFGEWSADRVGGNSGLVFEVEDVFRAAEDLKTKNVTLTVEPSVEFFGGWAMFQDSEGNVIGLHSPAPVATV